MHILWIVIIGFVAGIIPADGSAASRAPGRHDRKA
jgi:hypothetical protein